MEQVDAIVIGAGVVGLAVARALALTGREVVILERTNAIGTQTSSRHSEVIHAGIYYRAGSLKAQACVRGRQLLVDYCRANGVEHRQCGKLIVATSDEQVSTLHRLLAAGHGNGVADLTIIDAAQVREMEPALQCRAAIWSPSTGIIDSHGLMLSLQGQAEAHGAGLALLSRVVGLAPGGAGWVVQVASGATDDDPEPDADFELAAPLVVNCAGHAAPALASLAGAGPWPAAAPLAKGNYYRLAGRSPCSRLVYPVPEPGGLGVHLTIDLGGQTRFGPDVEWVDAFEYTVNPRRAEHFYDAIRRYWPALPDGALSPDYAGIRPKIMNGADISDDFFIGRQAGAGDGALVHLLGIESPGLTSSLALAERIVQGLGES